MGLFPAFHILLTTNTHCSITTVAIENVWLVHMPTVHTGRSTDLFVCFDVYVAVVCCMWLCGMRDSGCFVCLFFCTAHFLFLAVCFQFSLCCGSFVTYDLPLCHSFNPLCSSTLLCACEVFMLLLLLVFFRVSLSV